MKGKKASESRVSLSYLMLPQDTNPAGSIHGGVILKHIDTTAGVVAMRHVRGNAVTASLDRLDMLLPVRVGEFVTFKANLNMVGNTSMEVGVRVEAEDIMTGEVRHTASAYLTFVALDEQGKPTKAPPLILNSREEIRRNREALMRRKLRRAEKEMERNSREEELLERNICIEGEDGEVDCFE